MNAFRIVVWVCPLCIVSAMAWASSPQNPPSVGSIASRSILLNMPKSAQEPATDQETADNKVSIYWLGTACNEPSSVLCSHLNIKFGLVVHSVAIGSPAEKNGIRQYDIILSVNDQPMRTRNDLGRAVQEAHGDKISVEILRGGKKFKFDVRPEIKPKSLKVQAAVIALNGDEELSPQEVEELLKKVAPDGNLQNTQLLIFRSAVALDDSSEKGIVPGGKNQANGGAQMKVTLDGLQDAIILDSAMLDGDVPISGCCMKLIQAIEGEMEKVKTKIADYRGKLDATSDFTDEIKTSDDAELSEQRYHWRQMVQVNEIRLDLLSETRDRLKATMERQSQSQPDDAAPGQSSRETELSQIWS